ncbi:hypothetical protein DIPPA_33654 [Diplonema papillatum]|nr:hypothetical protein DIPPA_33654 [Diplonema papillatum]
MVSARAAAWLLLVSHQCIGCHAAITMACVREGGDLKTDMSAYDSLAQDRTNDEPSARFLKAGAAPRSTTDSVWLYIGESLQCTLTVDPPPGGDDTLSITLLQATLFNSTGAGLSAIDAAFEPALALSDGSGAALAAADPVELPAAAFSVVYPCDALGGAYRSSVAFQVSAAVRRAGGAVESEDMGVVEVQYFYGFPASVALECPADDQRLHAWSSTAANSVIPTEFGPVGTQAVNGTMAYCHITATDSFGAAVVADPAFGQSQGGLRGGTFLVQTAASLCTLPGGSTSACASSVSTGRGTISGDAGLSVYAAAIPFLRNVAPAGGPARTVLALEPLTFARISVAVSLTGDATRTAEAVVNVGGPVTTASVTCDSTVIDPSRPDAGSTCKIVPSTRFSALLTERTFAFAGDFVVTDRALDAQGSSAATFVSSSRPAKTAAGNVFKAWNPASAPGFEFDFVVSALPQPTDFDGERVTLHVYWNRTIPLLPDSCGVVGTSYELVALTSFPIVVAFTAAPEVTLLCDDVPCAEPNAAVLSRIDGVYKPLTVNPLVTGPGTSTLYFQLGARVPCWTSPNFTESACMSTTTHLDVVDINTETGSLRLLSLPADGSYTFTLTLRFSYNLNHSTSTANVAATASVLVRTNDIMTVGRTHVPVKELDGAGSMVVFCQDFADPHGNMSAWLSSALVDPSGQLLETEVVATAVYVPFEQQSAGFATQLAEIRFASSLTGQKVVVPTVGASAVQVSPDTPIDGAAVNLVDNDLGTDWIDYGKGDVSIELSEAAEFDSFTMVTGRSSPENDIVQWELTGSVDNVEWIVLHEQAANYPVPSSRGAQLAWFDLSRWQPAGAGGASTCTGCQTVRFDDVITSLRECKYVCERTQGCTHINWNPGDVVCSMHACASQPTLQASTTRTCYKFISHLKYLVFKPVRTREVPLTIWLRNPSDKSEAHFKVTCHVSDSLGASATAAVSEIVTLRPLELPRTPSSANAYARNLTEAVTSDAERSLLSLDEAGHAAEIVQSLSFADSNLRLQFVTAALPFLEAEAASMAASSFVEPAQAERLMAVVLTLAEIAEEDVSPRDPAANATLRAEAGRSVALVLQLLLRPRARFRVPEALLRTSARVAALLLAGGERHSIVPPGSHRPQAQSTPEERATLLLDVLCGMGSLMLNNQAYGSCASCESCQDSGIALSACLDTAFSIRGKRVEPSAESAMVFPATVNGQHSLIRDQAARVELGAPLALVGFTLPASPRSYDADAVVLRGPPAYFCLLRQSENASQRRPMVSVADSVLEVTVPVDPTTAAQVPVAMARRDNGAAAWLLDACDPSTVVAVAGSGGPRAGVRETCRKMTAGGATEYAAVAAVMHGRCVPGDIPGCERVLSAAAAFETCSCTHCSSQPAAGAPAGYFWQPAAGGKRCNPYETFTCEDAASGAAGYSAVLPEQCTGGSILVAFACVCPAGYACSDTACVAKKSCGALGGRAQCLASGLLHDAAKQTCECLGGMYCERGAAGDGACVDKATCSSARTVPDGGACAAGSVFDPETSTCVCPNTMFCQEAACVAKAVCGQKPARPESAYCWPQTTTQPQLVARTVASVNATTGELIADATCVCPGDLLCDAGLAACTCPPCVTGFCPYTADRSPWAALAHRCVCPEGKAGADCSAEEPRPPLFVTLRYPDGRHAAVAALPPAQAADLRDAVAGVIVSEANEGITPGGADTLLAREDVRAVYVEAGSIFVRSEIVAFASTWDNRLAHRLAQQKFGVAVARSLSDATAAQAGDLAEVSIATLAASCPSIEHCLHSPAPWRNCTCQQCADGFTQDGAAGPSECVAAAACTNAAHCSSRGRAVGLVAQGCRCECAANFFGLACEHDACLGSDANWSAPSCGPSRCGARIDGYTIVGDAVGECMSPDDDDLNGAEVVWLVIGVVLVACLAGVSVFWCRHHRCCWEPRKNYVDIDEEEEHLAPDGRREAGIHSPPLSHESDPTLEPTEVSDGVTEADTLSNNSANQVSPR